MESMGQPLGYTPMTARPVRTAGLVQRKSGSGYLHGASNPLGE
jgi:hypothetical protein